MEGEKKLEGQQDRNAGGKLPEEHMENAGDT